MKIIEHSLRGVSLSFGTVYIFALIYFFDKSILIDFLRIYSAALIYSSFVSFGCRQLLLYRDKQQLSKQMDSISLVAHMCALAVFVTVAFTIVILCVVNDGYLISILMLGLSIALSEIILHYLLSLTIFPFFALIYCVLSRVVSILLFFLLPVANPDAITYVLLVTSINLTIFGIYAFRHIYRMRELRIDNYKKIWQLIKHYWVGGIISVAFLNVTQIAVLAYSDETLILLFRVYLIPILLSSLCVQVMSIKIRSMAKLDWETETTWTKQKLLFLWLCLALLTSSCTYCIIILNNKFEIFAAFVLGDYSWLVSFVISLSGAMVLLNAYYSLVHSPKLLIYCVSLIKFLGILFYASYSFTFSSFILLHTAMIFFGIVYIIRLKSVVKLDA